MDEIVLIQPLQQSGTLVFTGSGHTKVQVEVDGAVYTVNVGGTFATSFKLVSVSGSTANFLYGDQPFTLTAPNPSGS